jgi:glycosyltransferase involved in cell wall biosynthesis
MNLPLVTCVIPTYRRPKLLKRAIKSVLNQTYSNLQICIYDNASGDETREIVASFAKNDKRVKYFCHDTNIGSLQNFAFGFNRVDSPYFSFLSDDDFIFPEFYETAICKLQEHPQAAFFGGKCVFIDQNNLIVDIRFKKKFDKLLTINESVDNFIGNDFIPWTSILFKTEKVKNFKLETTIKLHDVDFLYSIIYVHPIFISSKLCAVFSSTPNCASYGYKIEDVLPYVDILLPKLKNISHIDSNTHSKACQRIAEIVIFFYKSLIYQAINRKEFIESERLKIILKNKFNAIDLIKKINFYEKLRRYPLLWYSARIIRRLFKMILKLVIGLKPSPDREKILRKAIELQNKLE